MNKGKKQIGRGKTSDNIREKMSNWVGSRWLRPQKRRLHHRSHTAQQHFHFYNPSGMSEQENGIIFILSREWEKFLLEMHVKEMAEWGTGGEITQPALEKCLGLCHELINSPEVQEKVAVQSWEHWCVLHATNTSWSLWNCYSAGWSS